MKFDRCLRILPHQQDTGGFFVTVFHKVKPLPWESKKEHGKEVEKVSETGGQPTGAIKIFSDFLLCDVRALAHEGTLLCHKRQLHGLLRQYE